MRPNSLFFDRGGRQGLARAVSMIITIVFLVLVGYSIIRYKHFAYLLRTELFSTPQFGWLVLGSVKVIECYSFLGRYALAGLATEVAPDPKGEALGAFTFTPCLIRELL